MACAITPELDVADLQKSLAFYVGVIGCKIEFERQEERFVYIDLEGAPLMLQEAAGPGRRFRTAPLEHPYGRGINLQIEVADVDGLHGRISAARTQIVIPLEEKWYRQDERELGNRQFVVADPDGYLLRFFTDLGARP